MTMGVEVLNQLDVLELMIQNSTDLIWAVDKEYRLMFGNKAYHRAVEQSGGGTIKNGDLVLMPHYEQSFLDFWRTQYDKCLEYEFFNVESELIWNDGLHFFENSLSPLKVNNKIIGVWVLCRDITERKKMEMELQKAKELAEERESYINALIQSIDDIVVARNENFEVEYYNQAFDDITQKVFGVKAFKGLKTIDLLPPEAQTYWKEKLTNVLKGKRHDEVFEWKYNEEEVRHYEIVHFPVYYNNKTIGALEINRDITEKKKAELELLLAKEKAEESERLKTAFLQNMSHEIRTPLNAISGFAGVVAKPDLSEAKRNSYLSIIQSSSQQLMSIVNDILTISSLETGQEKVNISIVDVNQLLLDLLAIYKQQALNLNILIHVHQYFDDSQATIFTDKTKLNQVLANLLSNAIKFTHNGFIEFGYKLKSKFLEFYVKDTGIGIAPEAIDGIFDRFRQANSQISKLYGGTGLGLAISKSLTELMGGKIWVESVIHKGTTFYFTIPYTPIDNHPIPETESMHESPVLLIAEDEDFNFLYMAEVLSEFDLQIIHVRDGQDAVEVCKQNSKISLVLMDMKMPIMNGDEAARNIRISRPELTIIAQSAYILEKERATYDGVFHDYLVKPIREEALKNKVLKYLKLNKRK